jgi:hypothetical protein
MNELLTLIIQQLLELRKEVNELKKESINTAKFEQQIEILSLQIARLSNPKPQYLHLSKTKQNSQVL